MHLIGKSGPRTALGPGGGCPFLSRLPKHEPAIPLLRSGAEDSQIITACRSVLLPAELAKAWLTIGAPRAVAVTAGDRPDRTAYAVSRPGNLSDFFTVPINHPSCEPYLPA